MNIVRDLIENVSPRLSYALFFMVCRFQRNANTIVQMTFNYYKYVKESSRRHTISFSAISSFNEY